MYSNEVIHERQKLISKAVYWIAHNDNNGSQDALDANSVASYISTLLIADVFEVHADALAALIVKERKDSHE